MKTFAYTVSTNSIWTSFDYGRVEANNIDEARELSIKKLTEDFAKANLSLNHSDNTLGWEISFDSSNVQVHEVK